MQNVIWAEARKDISIEDCYFYHTMEIPNYGTVNGEWDLRGKESVYLGNTNFAGKRVMEIGTASGHLCFTMEKMGASIVAFDLSDEQDFDMVPYAGIDYGEYISARKANLRQLNNGFWLAHCANKSKAKVVYGTIYEFPDDIGQFDICTFGSVLLHLRDPFIALQRVTAHVRETAIVTDVLGSKGRMLSMAEKFCGIRLIGFLPSAKKRKPRQIWWRLSPGVISEFLQILGFTRTTISFHRQRYQNREIQLFTVVGHRESARAS